MNEKLQIGMRGHKKKNGRSPLRRWRSALDCGATEKGITNIKF